MSEAALARLTEKAAPEVNARQVIIRPVISEKSYALLAANKYTFRVHERANKTQVRQAVEDIFGVRVDGVRTAWVKPKPKRRGVTSGTPAPVEEGGRDPPSGRHDRAVRGSGDRITMAIKKYKPTSPGRRFATYLQHEAVTKGNEPEKSLTEGLTKSGGRNAHGRVTSRHRGGGAKRRYRKIDFKRTQGRRSRRRSPRSSTTRTARRTSRCSTTRTARSATSSRRRGSAWAPTVSSGPTADIAPGCSLPLANIPTGTTVHNVELTPGRGGQLGRSAGTAIQLVAKEGTYATLRLPSGEMRMVLVDCRATIGVLGNAEHEHVTLGKAGRSRHKGKRPQTRGVAMNPVDHPHGGGEAHHTPGGHPRTPWGVPDARLPHAQEEQDVRPLHRARPPSRQEGTGDRCRAHPRRARGSRSA